MENENPGQAGQFSGTKKPEFSKNAGRIYQHNKHKGVWQIGKEKTGTTLVRPGLG